MQTMSRLSKIFNPAGGEIGTLHKQRYRAFELLQQADREIRSFLPMTGP
jgi:hypothetical protein